MFDTETGKILKSGIIKYSLSARPESFIFGVVYGKDYCRVISSVEDFINEFKKRRYKNKLVFAHNAEYDLNVLFDNIYKLDPRAKFNGKFISASNGNCIFADSFNLLPSSVKAIGYMLGLHKGNLGNADLVSHVKNLKNDIKYCIRDCEIVYKALTKIFNDVEPAVTIGSLSLKLFRYKYLKHNVKINLESDEFFKAYYGGRTEAFYLGKCKGYVYDLNSAYPDAMAKIKFPDPSRLTKEIVSKETFLEMLNEYEGMATLTIQYNDHYHIPVLPYRKDNKLLFPLGRITGSWTFMELRYCIDNDMINVLSDSIEVVYSEAIDTIFDEFIYDQYNKRYASKDEFERYYLKLFQNNLYGKLVQRIDEEYTYCNDEREVKSYIKKNMKKIDWIEISPVNDGYFIRREIEDKMLSHTVACWGAYITAQVRLNLHVAMMSLPEHSIYYCDTDSVITSSKLPNKLIGKKLGQWKLEDKLVYDIKNLKDYRYLDDDGLKRKTKGLKKGSIQLDIIDDGGNVHELKDVYECERMVKTRESFRRLDKVPSGTFVKQLKKISGDYTKRIKMKNGFTKPIVL